MKTLFFTVNIVLVISCLQAGPTPRKPIPIVSLFQLQSSGDGHSPRIVNGKEAAPGQFPYQVGIFINDRAFGGGSLISKNWVLTAGHCVAGLSKWAVHLGAFNIRDNNEAGHIVVTSNKGFPHDNFDGATISNDVGLVQLPKEVTLNDRINIIKLAPKSYQDKNLAGTIAQASGWGKPADAENSISTTLRFVDLPIISTETCASFYGPGIDKFKYCCSGDGGKSTCFGDSGGPLTVVDGNTTVLQVGITSFVSSNGCESGMPSGYAAAPYYLDWISEKTGIAIE